MMADFRIGDRVRKVSGYHFDGVVVGRFATTAGRVRYVVEMDGSGGLLHIFSAEQLDPRLSATPSSDTGEKQ